MIQRNRENPETVLSDSMQRIYAAVYFIHTAIIIGFDAKQYTVNESESSVWISVLVFSGTIQGSVGINAWIVPGTALGEGTSLQMCSYPSLPLLIFLIVYFTLLHF